jgi:thiamine kinase-like enzyme
VDAEAVAALAWPGRTVALEPLGGGITNHNFKVDVNGERFVLRIAGADTELLGIDRQAEHDAALVAASLGVGPEVVEFVAGSLITRFVDGRRVPVEEMRQPESLREVATVLRRIHEGPAIPGRFDSFRVVEKYREIAAAHGVEIPAAYEQAKAKADRIEVDLGPRPEQPCHNDLLNANFLDDGERLRIVDWEYAGMGDLFFDLANFSINHELGEEERHSLLVAYFGVLSPDDTRALELMRFMSDFREAMWGVVQTAISELDFDFAAYAREHFERLERTAAEPSFRAALEA